MQIIVNGNAKEIAALVLELQGRAEIEVIADGCTLTETTLKAILDKTEGASYG